MSSYINVEAVGVLLDVLLLAEPQMALFVCGVTHFWTWVLQSSVRLTQQRRLEALHTTAVRCYGAMQIFRSRNRLTRCRSHVPSRATTKMQRRLGRQKPGGDARRGGGLFAGADLRRVLRARAGGGGRGSGANGPQPSVILPHLKQGEV